MDKLNKRRFEQYLELLKINNNDNLQHNDFVPHDGNTSEDLTSRLKVNEENGRLIIAEEKQMLVCNSMNYTYEINSTAELTEPETGGMSVKSLVELPLPGIPSDRDLEAVDRHDELNCIPLNKEPLPKNFRKPHHIDHTKTQLDLLHQDSIHATSASAVAANVHKRQSEILKGNNAFNPNQQQDNINRKPLLKNNDTKKGSKNKKTEPVVPDALPGAAWNKR